MLVVLLIKLNMINGISIIGVKIVKIILKKKLLKIQLKYYYLMY